MCVGVVRRCGGSSCATVGSSNLVEGLHMSSKSLGKQVVLVSAGEKADTLAVAAKRTPACQDVQDVPAALCQSCCHS